MTNCDRCGKESGKLYCGRCRAIVQKERGVLIPVLYFDPETGLYVCGCTVTECPCNNLGTCSGKISLDTFKAMCHEFDGDNCIKQVCG
jgi:hypothetical protein